MLVMFRFKNYGPFKDEAVLDMRAVKSYKEHPYNLISIPNSGSLLKTVAIYGANASGKSNLVNAYKSFLTIVRDSFRKNDKEESKTVLEKQFYPFFFDDESTESDAEFEAVFQADGSEYKYGFIYNRRQIRYEWLYKKNLATNRQSKIFERDPDKINLGSSVKKTCEKYLADIDIDVLALSFFSSLRLRSHVFKEAMYCITDFLPISFSCDGQAELFLKKYFENDFDEKEKPKLLSFLNAIDVGIKDITVRKNDNNLVVYTTHVGKNNKTYEFPLEIESDGTKRAIAIYSFARIAALYGQGLIIDELNNQLHPLLQKYLIDLIYEEGSEGQLIYTTHDTSLMDKQFMRRDQIWFVSKDNDGLSTLYSLAEFKIRNDKSFSKDYLEGIYGGIPILSAFSFKEDRDGV